MELITELTQEQENLIDVYYKKWLNIGYQSHEDTNRNLAEQAVVKIYKELGLQKPKIFWFDSQLKAEKKLTKLNVSTRKEYGNFEAHWLGFRDYFNKVLNIDFDENQILFDEFCKYAQNCGTAYFYEKGAVLCDKFSIKRRNENEMKIYIEKDPDFKPIYIINNVEVPEYLYNTPGEQLDIKQYFKESNVEVKREFYRKIGAERFLKESKAESLDKWETPQIKLLNTETKENIYELLLIDIGLPDKIKYMKESLVNKHGLKSYYLVAVPDQKVTTAKDAFLSINPNVPKAFFDNPENKIRLS